MFKDMPSFIYTPPTEELKSAVSAISSVNLGTGGDIDIPTWPASPSTFPNDIDSLKVLDWMAQPNQQEVKDNLTLYYRIMGDITNGTVVEADLFALKQLLPKIRPYVLTEDDYNLLASALLNIETYIVKYLDDDLTEKALQIDEFFTELLRQLNTWIVEVNTVLSDLKTYYNTNILNTTGQAPMSNGIAVDFA